MMNKEENPLIEVAKDITCKMIIAELENIREQLNMFIDDLIEIEIKNFSE